MDSELQNLIASVAKRPAEAKGIQLASAWVRSVSLCMGDEKCLAQFAGLSAKDWDLALSKAASTLTYINDETVVKAGRLNVTGGVAKLWGTEADVEEFRKAAKEPQAKAIAEFTNIYSSTKQDHDGDVLEAEGGELDPMMPLLWQHIPMQPIGKLVSVLDQNKKNIKTHYAIADTALGQDAATLAEFGALRFSHGFKPVKYEKLARTKQDDLDGTQPGFHVTKWKGLEGSLVSVPSNTDAVILAFSRQKLTHPLTKAWGDGLYRKRPTVVNVPGNSNIVYETIQKAIDLEKTKCGDMAYAPGYGNGNPPDARVAAVQATRTADYASKWADSAAERATTGDADSHADAIEANTSAQIAHEQAAHANQAIGNQAQADFHTGEAKRHAAAAASHQESYRAAKGKSYVLGTKACGCPTKAAPTMIDEDKVASVAKALSKHNDKSPDYGQTFLHPEKASVHYVTADSDHENIANTAKEKFGAIAGVKSVTCEAESFPTKGDGWRQVYPTKKDHKAHDAGLPAMLLKGRCSKDDAQNLSDSMDHMAAVTSHEKTPDAAKDHAQKAYTAIKDVHTKHTTMPADKADHPYKKMTDVDMEKMADACTHLQKAADHAEMPQGLGKKCLKAKALIKAVAERHSAMGENEDVEDDQSEKSADRHLARAIGHLLAGRGSPQLAVILKDQCERRIAVADEQAAARLLTA